MKLLAAVVLSTSCATTPPAPTPAHHHAGDRDGIHGMVVFGRTHYFLEHIPMFSPPHDEQLVMRVRLATADGAAVTNDFSDQGYSIQPTSRFSLDDLALGKRTTFDGNLHRGNFEADGPLLLANVKVTVEQVLVARRLPGGDEGEGVFVVGDAGDAYATNVIGPAHGIQRIVRLDNASVTPSPSKAQRVPGKLAGHELWCLKAPEFTERCD